MSNGKACVLDFYALSELRDKFAGQALIGLLLWSTTRGCGNLLQPNNQQIAHDQTTVDDCFAKAAYAFADSMLKVREI